MSGNRKLKMAKLGVGGAGILPAMDASENIER